MDNLPAPLIEHIASRLPKEPTCWRLFRKTLEQGWKIWVLEAEVAQLKRELKAFTALKRSVNVTRDALQAAAIADEALRKALEESTAVKLGEGYNIEWGHKTEDDT